MANAYYKEENLDKALLYYKKILEINPESAQVCNNIAVIHYYKKDYLSAWQYLTKAEELGIAVDEDLKKILREKLKK